MRYHPISLANFTIEAPESRKDEGQVEIADNQLDREAEHSNEEQQPKSLEDEDEIDHDGLSQLGQQLNDANQKQRMVN